MPTLKFNLSEAEIEKLNYERYAYPDPVIAILIPKYPLVKEWAYAGFFFLMTGALISHLAMGDGGNAIFGPLFQTIFVVLSWYFRPADRKITTNGQTAV